VFRAKRADPVKLLFWDQTGLQLGVFGGQFAHWDVPVAGLRSPIGSMRLL
jgi:hypothetical protein